MRHRRGRLRASSVPSLPLRRWVLAAGVLLLTVAGGSTTCVHSGEPGPAPPAELIANNIESSDETLVLTVTAVEQVETVGAYTTWTIEASVDRVIRGSLPPGSRISYRRTLEGVGPAALPGRRYLASFELRDGARVLPDSAYHFEYSRALEQVLERITSP